MPGLAMVAEVNVDKARFASSLRRVQCPGYELSTLHAGEHIAVGHAAHLGYPVTVYAQDGGFAILEGAVYGPDETTMRLHLLALLATFERDEAAGRSAAESWAATKDGEFVLILGSPKKSRFLLVNDTLGRLPLYHKCSPSTVVIAREIKFVEAWAGMQGIDPHGVAQMFLFGWSLGTRTMLRGVSRLRPGSSIYWDSAKNVLEIRQYHDWNFESLGQQSPRRGAATELALQFVDRCGAQMRWAGNRPLAVSLSGGLDSRNVACGLVRAGAQITAYTQLDAAREYSADAAVAERIAHQLNVRWTLYRLPPPNWPEAERLIELRDGMNGVSASFMLEYLNNISQRSGANVCYFTGDGGDKSLGEVPYPPVTRNLEEHVDLLLRGGIWSAQTVSEFVAVPVDALRECILEDLSAYPERSPAARAARFAHSEQGWHYLFEGEDRNRSLVWSTTPFYCQSFLIRALAISPTAKKHNEFYGQVMRALNPDVAGIPNANWGFAVGTARARLRASLHDVAVRLPRPLRGAIRKQMLPFHASTHILPRYRERVRQAFTNPYVGTILSQTAIERALDGGFSRLQSQALITPLLYLEGRSATSEPPCVADVVKSSV